MVEKNVGAAIVAKGQVIAWFWAPDGNVKDAKATAEAFLRLTMDDALQRAFGSAVDIVEMEFPKAEDPHDRSV